MTNCGNVYAEKMRRYRLILHTIFRLVTSNFLANENLQNRRRKLIFSHKEKSILQRLNFFLLFINPHFPLSNIRHRPFPNTDRTVKDTASFKAFIGKANGIRRTNETVLALYAFESILPLQLCSTEESFKNCQTL